MKLFLIDLTYDRDRNEHVILGSREITSEELMKLDNDQVIRIESDKIEKSYTQAFHPHHELISAGKAKDKVRSFSCGTTISYETTLGEIYNMERVENTTIRKINLMGTAYNVSILGVNGIVKGYQMQINGQRIEGFFRFGTKFKKLIS